MTRQSHLYPDGCDRRTRLKARNEMNGSLGFVRRVPATDGRATRERREFERTKHPSSSKTGQHARGARIEREARPRRVRPGEEGFDEIIHDDHGATWSRDSWTPRRGDDAAGGDQGDQHAGVVFDDDGG